MSQESPSSTSLQFPSPVTPTDLSTAVLKQTKLLPNDGTAGDNFGMSVAIYGDTAIVGSPYDDDNGDGSGSAYVFVWDASTNIWMQ